MADLSNNQTDWSDLLAPWLVGEGPLMPERDFTPWAHPGWKAWNGHAVEAQVAYFLQELTEGIVSRSSEGVIVVETGTGQGFVTRRIASALDHSRDTLLCFESDVEWRSRLLSEMSFFETYDSLHDGPLLAEHHPTPQCFHFDRADLVILDSMDPLRMAELCMWAALAKPDSYLFLHDAGMSHPSWDGHYTLAQLVRTLQIPGMWLENPRGGFIARRNHVEVEPWVVDLWASILERVYAWDHA